MKKKVYQKPLLMSEDFVPQEYVAVCWGVGCDVTTSNQIEKDLGVYKPGVLDHGADHCGLSANQVIRDSNDDGIGDEMVEVGTDGLGTLKCTIYSDAYYTQMIPVSSVKIGSTIYWTTASGNKVWHHVGTVSAVAPGRPNMS